MCETCDDKPESGSDQYPEFAAAGFPHHPGESDRDLISAYQEHHDLLVDGRLGPVTQRHLKTEAAGRVCAVPERMSGGRKCRWDSTTWDGQRWLGNPKRLRLAWAIASDVDRRMVASLAWAWAQWEDHLAIEAEMVHRDDPGLAVLFTHQRIDGRSGTLAWAQLPCGPDRRLESRIDASESWHLDPDTPPVRGRIHLGGVMCHEIGHLLGLDHIPTSRGRALLNPTYGPDVLTPQPLDVAEGVFRYGPASDVRPTPTPDPPPAPADAIAVTAVHDGHRYAGTLARTA